MIVSTTRKLIIKTCALFIILCLTSVYVLAEPATGLLNAVPQANGTIITTGNQPILVNGNSTTPGTTILSGSTLETPSGVGATLQLGFADLEIAPGTELTIEFTADGQVKITLKHGCAILKTKNAEGQILTPDGTTTQTGKNDKTDICFPVGASSPVVNQGAALNAGAGAGGGGGGGGGVSGVVLGTTIGGGVLGTVLIIILVNDDSPSSNSVPGQG